MVLIVVTERITIIYYNNTNTNRHDDNINNNIKIFCLSKHTHKCMHIGLYVFIYVYSLQFKVFAWQIFFFHKS